MQPEELPPSPESRLLPSDPESRLSPLSSPLHSVQPPCCRPGHGWQIRAHRSALGTTLRRSEADPSQLTLPAAPSPVEFGARSPAAFFLDVPRLIAFDTALGARARASGALRPDPGFGRCNVGAQDSRRDADHELECAGSHKSPFVRFATSSKANCLLKVAPKLLGGPASERLLCTGRPMSGELRHTWPAFGETSECWVALASRLELGPDLANPARLRGMRGDAIARTQIGSNVLRSLPTGAPKVARALVLGASWAFEDFAMFAQEIMSLRRNLPLT